MEGENPVSVSQPPAREDQGQADGGPDIGDDITVDPPLFQEGGSSSSSAQAPDQIMSADDAAQVGQICSIVNSLRALGADTHETIYDLSRCVYGGIAAGRSIGSNSKPTVAEVFSRSRFTDFLMRNGSMGFHRVTVLI